MLSRDAEACFWIGRYVERAEAVARMLDVHYHAALESPRSPINGEAEEGETESAGADDISPMSWSAVLAISGLAASYRATYGAETDRNVLDFFIFNPGNPFSIMQTWTDARENARSIREQLASEMWESLNVSYLELRRWNVDRVLADGPHGFFTIVKNASHLFQGILNRTMIMGETRDWLDVGRFLERPSQTARLLDVKYHDLLPTSRAGGPPEPGVPDAFGVGGALDAYGWVAILKSVSAFEMFRKTHKEGFRPASVIDFLVLNGQFPASVRHCVGRVEGCLRRISGNVREEPANDAERQIGRLRADLAFARPADIVRAGLHEYLESVQRRFEEISVAINETYLSY